MTIGRLGRMAYINTLPVDWGLLSTPLADLVNIYRGTPTTLNRLLAEARLDVSPVSSVAAAERADEWLVLDKLCIGCRGEVGSVILQSERPVEELHGSAIAVTAASATAARLLKLLLSLYWRITVEFVPQDRPAAARLLIGDAALKAAQSGDGRFVYDMGQMWKDFTGHDFVFGLWCVRRAYAQERPREALALYHLLQTSYSIGRNEAPAVVTEAARITELAETTIDKYFPKLAYDLDEPLWAGLERFLELIGYPPGRLGIFGRPQFDEGMRGELGGAIGF
jgi:chorismate dehydratase